MKKAIIPLIMLGALLPATAQEQAISPAERDFTVSCLQALTKEGAKLSEADIRFLANMTAELLKDRKKSGRFLTEPHEREPFMQIVDLLAAHVDASEWDDITVLKLKRDVYTAGVLLVECSRGRYTTKWHFAKQVAPLYHTLTRLEELQKTRMESGEATKQDYLTARFERLRLQHEHGDVFPELTGEEEARQWAEIITELKTNGLEHLLDNHE